MSTIQEERERALYDLDAERGVLGGCMMYMDALLQVVQIASARDFQLLKHAQIYEAILSLVEQRQPVDPITVRSVLEERGQDEAIGGLHYLLECADCTTAFNAPYYAGMVVEKARQRQLIELGAQLQADVLSGLSADEAQRQLAERLAVHTVAARTKPEWEAQAIDAASLYRAQFPPQVWVVDQIIPQGTLLLTGKPKTKKSWLALNLALAVAHGGKALGHFQAMKGEVLYVDLEMGQRRLHERLHVVSPHAEPPNTLHFVTEWPRIYDGCERYLDSWMERHPYTRLIVFDTQVAIRPPREGREEPYEHEKKYMQVLTNFCHTHNVAMVLIHHSRKMGGSDVIDDASGTTGLTAGVDNYGSLARSQHEKGAGVLELLWAVQRHVRCAVRTRAARARSGGVAGQGTVGVCE